MSTPQSQTPRGVISKSIEAASVIRSMSNRYPSQQCCHLKICYQVPEILHDTFVPENIATSNQKSMLSIIDLHMFLKKCSDKPPTITKTFCASDQM